MLGERNVVYVVFIIELESLESLGNLEILKILTFLNLLTYILIAINKTTIRITDSFSFDYANLLYCLIALLPYSHGLSTDVLLWLMTSSNRTSFRSTRFCVSKWYNVGRALMLYRSCWSISGAYTLSHAEG